MEVDVKRILPIFGPRLLSVLNRRVSLSRLPLPSGVGMATIPGKGVRDLLLLRTVGIPKTF